MERKISFLLLLLMMIGSNNMFGQREKVGGQRMSGELYCANKDFKFKVENNYHKDGSKVYVCPKNLPTNITIVNASDNMPVVATCSWKINSSLSPITLNPLILQKNNLVNKKSELEVNFTDPISGQNINLALDVLTSIKLEFSESAKNYQFDDNNIQPYISSYSGTEKLGTPWNFIENGNIDILKGETSPNKGFYAINNYMSNNSSLNISPNNFSASAQDVTFQFSGSGNNIIEVKGCNEIEPELLLFSESMKSLDLEIFELCDTDDDIPKYCPSNRMLQADCLTPISSPLFVCIEGGADLTIDEMYRTNSSGQLVIEAKGDRLGKVGNTYNVYAGANLRCDHNANPNKADECPYPFDVNSSKQVVTDTYGKIAITLNSIGPISLRMNYDLVIDDGILDILEYEEIHGQRVQNGEFIDGFVEVYLVKELEPNNGAPRNGVAFQGSKSLSINTKIAPISTMAHEIGHAKWGFDHPDMPPLNVNDSNNFMYFTPTGRTMNVRRYQFDKMHK